VHKLHVREKAYLISGTTFAEPRFIVGAVASNLTLTPSIAEVTAPHQLWKSL
jgi:hypothetical protein